MTELRERVVDVGIALDEILNPAARKVGFVLLVYPLGVADGECSFVCNSANQTDLAALFRQVAERIEAAGRQKQ